MEPRFVGRADELAELVGLLDAALDGRPGFAVLAGEPGIGKTRLAEELAALAGARAVPVLWGGCTAAEGAPAYWPWRRVLRSWLASVGPARAAAAMVGFGEVARLAPELPGEPVESDRFALFDAVARFLAAVAEEAGLVLVLDDVQWADADSLALLAHVTREVTRGRLLVVVTVRPAERDLALGGLVIELFGWDDAEVGAALGGVPDPDFVAAVARRSGGNPFFVGELARAGTAGLRVPAAARDVVRARIRRLPEPCRALLGVAAVLGRDVDAALLASVTGVDGVLDGLRPALDDGVLDHPAGRVGLRFTHDLVRESVLADLPATEQARVHLAVVAALTPSADDPDVVAELAHHALAALPAGDRVAATAWARRAAAIAHSRLAYDEAARLLADALAAGRPVLSPSERLSVLLELARARGLAHDVAGAIGTFTEAAELARATGDAAGLAAAALGLPEVSEMPWLDVARGWCEEALRGLGDGDSPLKAKLLAQVAHGALFTADPRTITDASAAALAMAERLDDPSSLAIALRARQLARAGADGNAERLVLGGRLLALGERTGDQEDVLWGRLWRFDALLQAGRVLDAEAELDALEPVVATLRRPLARLHLLRNRVTLALGRGRFAEGRALNEETIALAERGGHLGAYATARSLRLGIAARTGGDPGDLDWLRTHPARMLPMAALSRAQMSLYFVARGDWDEAREWYASLPGPGSPQVPAFMALALEGLRALLLPDFGDAATAEAVHRLLLPYADLHLVGGAGAITTGGSVRGALGIAAHVAGKPDVAVRHLRTAVTVNDAAGLAYPALLARVALAVALRARARPSDGDEAAALLAEADAAATRLDMPPQRARIAELRAVADDGGVLSRREAEIAELVGRGLTNRQIATSAHISERTVETHVGHVLAKLGFTRRSEIAAWAAGRKQ
ncbi:MAG TPA: AAA family ATPase [Pseudonocardia sp.]|nr:AAA family ATPase [Pseudonocardia sp.]